MKKLKIVCLGDSITFGYTFQNNKVLQAKMNYPYYLQMLLEDQYDVEVINSGMSGWQVKQANQYLEDLVITHKPDICFIMYGVNDMMLTNRGGLPVSYKYFFENLNEVVLKLKLNNIKPVVLTPICVDNKRINKLSNEIINYGILMDVETIDVNSETRLLVEQSNDELSDVLPDSIHFREDWYHVIAEIVYKKYFKE